MKNGGGEGAMDGVLTSGVSAASAAGRGGRCTLGLELVGVSLAPAAIARQHRPSHVRMLSPRLRVELRNCGTDAVGRVYQVIVVLPSVLSSGSPGPTMFPALRAPAASVRVAVWRELAGRRRHAPAGCKRSRAACLADAGCWLCTAGTCMRRLRLRPSGRGRHCA